MHLAPSHCGPCGLQSPPIQILPPWPMCSGKNTRLPFISVPSRVQTTGFGLSSPNCGSQMERTESPETQAANAKMFKIQKHLGNCSNRSKAPTPKLHPTARNGKSVSAAPRGRLRLHLLFALLRKGADCRSNPFRGIEYNIYIYMSDTRTKSKRKTIILWVHAVVTQYFISLQWGRGSGVPTSVDAHG